MGSSVGGENLNPNPWAPYDTYRDCSQGICSIYCPQWCYIMFSPPPPSFILDDGDSTTNFSPLLIALIGVLASAFILVSYYTLIYRFCRRGGSSEGSTSGIPAGRIHSVNEASTLSGGGVNPPAVAGLDEGLIKSIAVYKYRKEDGVVNCVDCCVCLSEFEENESVRLLPECTHAFHVPCIDTWLKSHSNCPLCRASIAAASAGPNPPTTTVPTVSSGRNRTSETSVSVMEYRQRSENSVVVIVNSDSEAREEVVLTVPIGEGDNSSVKPPEREDRVRNREERR